MDRAPYLQIRKKRKMNKAKVSKTHWKTLDNPNYLGAYSLQDGENKEIDVIIERVIIEKLKGTKDGDQGKVAYLKGLKPMILNATNCKVITKLFSTPYVDDWAGKKITLYVAKIRAFGEDMEALRVKTTAPVIVLPELLPNTEAWTNCIKALNNGFTIDQIKEKYKLSEANEADLLTAVI